MANNLTDEEFEAFISAKNEREWNELCDKVKAARNGVYPPDWFARMNKSGVMHMVMSSWKR